MKNKFSVRSSIAISSLCYSVGVFGLIFGFIFSQWLVFIIGLLFSITGLFFLRPGRCYLLTSDSIVYKSGWGIKKELKYVDVARVFLSNSSDAEKYLLDIIQKKRENGDPQYINIKNIGDVSAESKEILHPFDYSSYRPVFMLIAPPRIKDFATLARTSSVILKGDFLCVEMKSGDKFFLSPKNVSEMVDSATKLLSIQKTS